MTNFNISSSGLVTGKVVVLMSIKHKSVEVEKSQLNTKRGYNTACQAKEVESLMVRPLKHALMVYRSLIHKKGCTCQR